MLKANLLIISLTAPPEICGVSDYAFESARALLDQYDSITIGVDRFPGKITATDQRISVLHWKEALKTKEPTIAIINYTPRGYQKYALPLGLMNSLTSFKKSNSGNKLFILFHETWDGGTGLKIHHLIMDKFAMYISKKLALLSDGVATITDEQKSKVIALTGFSKVSTLTVGANIFPSDPLAGLTSIRDPGVWVIFGLPHTRLWTLEANLVLIKKLIQEGMLKTIRSIGPSDHSPVALEEKQYAANHFGENILVQLGSIAPGEVTKELLTAYGAFVGQTADSLRKSGSFAAIAAHATPVVCNAPNSLVTPPGLGFFNGAELASNPALFELEKTDRSTKLHRWYWETRSWKAIASDLNHWINK
jgi:hypothetical protein